METSDKKIAILHMVRKTGELGARECSSRRMPNSARAFRVISDATAAIGEHVPSWQNSYGMAVRGAPIAPIRKRAKAKAKAKTKRRRTVIPMRRRGRGRIVRREPPWMKGLRAAHRARKGKGKAKRRARRK